MVHQLEQAVHDLSKLARSSPPSIAHHVTQAVRHLNAALDNARAEERQYARVMPRYRGNPELLIFNPPAERRWHTRQGGVLSEEARELRYRHAENGKLYRHPFETDVTVRAIVGPEGAHDILLASPHGLHLWEDF